MSFRSPLPSSKQYGGFIDDSHIPSSPSYKVSDSVNLSSSPHPTEPDSEGSGSRSSPRKRKRGRDRSQSTTRAPSRRKRLKPFYTSEYLQAYNRIIHHVNNQDILVEEAHFERSQLGLTIWSPSEKELLFRALASKGRHDIHSIAGAVGSKSEPEVAACLLLLDEASTTQQIHEPNKSLLDPSEISAAFEVSDECEKALEDAADALAFLQQSEEEKAERKQHGEYWLLTTQIANRIDKELRKGPEGEAVVAETVPAATLLDFKSCLKLMERFFMNSSDPNYNYRTYTNRYERMSVYNTAFSDLHNLVTSFTKRIVQSTLFTASSRLRAMKSSGYTPRREVTRADVVAALEVLGMKADAHQYWVGLARRCQLKVYYTESARDRRWRPVGSQLDYDTVEAALDTTKGKKGHYERTPLEVSSRALTPLGKEADLSGSADTTSEYAASVAESDEASSDSVELPLDDRSANALKTQDYHAQSQDNYVSALDSKASLREEIYLWDTLGRQPAHPAHPEDVDIPGKPVFEPKPLEDIDDWRRPVSYAAEWEAPGMPVPEKSFKKNRKGYGAKAIGVLNGGQAEGSLTFEESMDEATDDVSISERSSSSGNHQATGQGHRPFNRSSVTRSSRSRRGRRPEVDVHKADNEAALSSAGRAGASSETSIVGPTRGRSGGRVNPESTDA